MNFFLRTFKTMNAAKPLIVLAAVALVAIAGAVDPAFAQSALNGDANKPIQAVRQAVNVAMWFTLGMGIIGLCWAGWNKTAGKAWGGQLMGGAICLGISGVIAFVNQIANGQAPNLGEF